ncbi:AP-4 complex accessory subunit tepsin isoform X2 [Bombina bombina]|uniref:AP-4 complex accessory subunit tepsin isoform X2 n=1 Tax=Bombina bombina TaxID=8345 RepID=UPI00235B2E56|nr:AP-4 complex accessory subunit tepsin isoform X2 [Bombina bombina]
MAVLDKLKFLHQLPLLLKGTSDDDTPCPGYIYEEIAKISYESPGNCLCLLEHLLHRLQNKSCHVKLKVLKIFLSLGSHGSPIFVQHLRHNASFIQEAADVNGPFDPIHDSGLYQKIRATAKDLLGSLFSDTTSQTTPLVLSKERSQTGMGSQATHPQALQGFGYTQEGTSGETFLNGIQRAAAAVTHAVLPGAASLSTCRRDEVVDTYRPVTIPSSDNRHHTGKLLHDSAQSVRVSHHSGVPGGGWDESDSGHSSHDSSQDKSTHSRCSDAASKSGSDGQSRSTNRENSDMTERVESTHPGDCQQEAQLVWAVTRGCRVFLTREEVQHFVRGCSVLNCEVVFEMLNYSLMNEDSCIKMRSMCAIAALMTSDLLSHDHMLGVVQRNLQMLSEGSPGPVTNKATKILRQFEALTQNSVGQGALRPKTVQYSVEPPPLDLLSDVLPPPEEGRMLTPVSLPSSPTLVTNTQSLTDCCSSVNKAASNGNKSWDTAKLDSEREIEVADCAESSDQRSHGVVSLFDGMELLPLVRSSDRGDGIEGPTIEQPRTHTENSDPALPKPGLTSVFSFLNST